MNGSTKMRKKKKNQKRLFYIFFKFQTHLFYLLLVVQVAKLGYNWPCLSLCNDRYPCWYGGITKPEMKCYVISGKREIKRGTLSPSPSFSLDVFSPPTHLFSFPFLNDVIWYFELYKAGLLTETPKHSLLEWRKNIKK